MNNDEEEIKERIEEHYEDPFHFGELPTATHAHEEFNPLCGDRVNVQLLVNEAGQVEDCFYSGKGCKISQASASMLMEEILGKTVDEVKKFSATDMLELYGARLTPM